MPRERQAGRCEKPLPNFTVSGGGRYTSAVRNWLTNRFRMKVGLFMLPLLLPVGGAVVDADFERPVAQAVQPWTPLPTAATSVSTDSVFTPTMPNRPTLRSDGFRGAESARP